MPGPRNKRKTAPKKQKRAPARKMENSKHALVPLPPSPSPSRSPSPQPAQPTTQPDVTVLVQHKQENIHEYPESKTASVVLPPSPSPSPPPSRQLENDVQYDGYPPVDCYPHPRQYPQSPIPPPPPIQTFLHDPGTGPRVLSMRQFLKSPFAHKPSLQDPLCAEFSQEEVLEMFLGVLPEEMALILWYNKSRLYGRVCPTCGRLFRLGDVLPAHAILNACADEEGDEGRCEVKQSERLLKEQQMSGLCSPLCFITAACTYPDHVIRSIWGCSADQVDDSTWDAMSGTGHGLDLLVKMTRMEDLGLAQLYFPREEFDTDSEQRIDLVQ